MHDNLVNLVEDLREAVREDDHTEVPAMQAGALGDKWLTFGRRLAAFLGDARTKAFAAFLLDWLGKKAASAPAAPPEPPGGAA